VTTIPSSLDDRARSSDAEELRDRIVQIRRHLTAITEAYRQATTARESSLAIRLLRERSVVMRQLLETQCELLLIMRHQLTEPAAGPAAEMIDA
jgi:hypothetical protein